MDITKRLRAAILAAALTALILGPSTVQSENKTSGGIAFLTVLLTHDSVQLTGWTITKGTLRQPRTPTDRGNLEYEALSLSGDVVWKGSLSDPLVRRLEYEDPDNPGQLKAKIIKADTARFVVRIPADAVIDRITFYRVERRSEAGEKSAAVRRLLGSVSCPWREVKK